MSTDHAHRIVSSEREQLILVDADDRELGFESKAACHDGEGVLHRAFSLFLFDADGRLLLQRRAAGKRLWPGYWSNSCCSHPRRGETLEVATQRRLDDELNVAAELEYVYRFCYQARYDRAGSENESCHVFLGRIDGEVRPNESEIDGIRFLSRAEIDRLLADEPAAVTPWFKLEWRALSETHNAALARYAM